MSPDTIRLVTFSSDLVCRRCLWRAFEKCHKPLAAADAAEVGEFSITCTTDRPHRLGELRGARKK
jgi:hypothetical protein